MSTAQGQRTGRAPAAGVSALPTLIAMLAVGASLLPLSQLFTGQSWTGPLIAVLVVVGLTAVVGRWAGLPAALVPLAQFVTLGGVLTAIFGAGTGVVGIIPLPSTLVVWGDLFRDALAAVASSPPPAPSTAGVVFTVCVAAGVVAVCTDALAVTWARPALAGLPLLVPFLVSVANAAGGLQVGYVVALGAAWLALLAVVDDARVAGWSRRNGGSGSRAGRRSRLVTAAVTALVALSGSLVLAGLVPVAADSALSQRLGISGGAGRVGFSPSPDMLSDLQDSSPTSVLRYRSDDPDLPPLRVAVSTEYSEGQWLPRPVREPVSTNPMVVAPPGLGAQVARAEHTFSVVENRLDPPNLAAPALVTGGVVNGAEWAMDPDTGVLATGAMPTHYELRYVQVHPSASQLQAARSGEKIVDGVDPVLDTSAVSTQTSRVAAQVTASAQTPYDKAVALQNWLRSTGGFTYSLEVEPAPEQMSSQEAARTSVDRFLSSKRGYCVQFSTAMTLMARSVGIPARLATGFLPGRLDNDTRRVLSSDAHAWPELYFEGVGWVRFEPTPGVQSGPAPQYAPDPSDVAESSATPSATPTPTPTPSTSASPTPEPTASAPPAAGEQQSAESRFDWARLRLALMVALGVGGVGWLVSAPARWARADRRAALAGAGSQAGAVEAVWWGLVEQLGDLGVAVSPARVLPDQVADVARDGELDVSARARLEQLGAAVEHARYAPPAAPRPWRRSRERSPGWAADPAVANCADDANAVLAAARSGRGWGTRVVATIWPASGRAAARRRIRAAWSTITRRGA